MKQISKYMTLMLLVVMGSFALASCEDDNDGDKTKHDTAWGLKTIKQQWRLDDDAVGKMKEMFAKLMDEEDYDEEEMMMMQLAIETDDIIIELTDETCGILAHVPERSNFAHLAGKYVLLGENTGGDDDERLEYVVDSKHPEIGKLYVVGVGYDYRYEMLEWALYNESEALISIAVDTDSNGNVAEWIHSKSKAVVPPVQWVTMTSGGEGPVTDVDDEWFVGEWRVYDGHNDPGNEAAQLLVFNADHTVKPVLYYQGEVYQEGETMTWSVEDADGPSISDYFQYKVLVIDGERMEITTYGNNTFAMYDGDAGIYYRRTDRSSLKGIMILLTGDPMQKSKEGAHYYIPFAYNGHNIDNISASSTDRDLIEVRDIVETDTALHRGYVEVEMMGKGKASVEIYNTYDKTMKTIVPFEIGMGDEEAKELLAKAFTAPIQDSRTPSVTRVVTSFRNMFADQPTASFFYEFTRDAANQLDGVEMGQLTQTTPVYKPIVVFGSDEATHGTIYLVDQTSGQHYFTFTFNRLSANGLKLVLHELVNGAEYEYNLTPYSGGETLYGRLLPSYRLQGMWKTDMPDNNSWRNNHYHIHMVDPSGIELCASYVAQPTEAAAAKNTGGYSDANKMYCVNSSIYNYPNYTSTSNTADVTLYLSTGRRCQITQFYTDDASFVLDRGDNDGQVKYTRDNTPTKIHYYTDRVLYDTDVDYTVDVSEK